MWPTVKRGAADFSPGVKRNRVDTATEVGHHLLVGDAVEPRAPWVRVVEAVAAELLLATLEDQRRVVLVVELSAARSGCAVGEIRGALDHASG